MLNCFNRVQLFVTIWTISLQAPLPIGFYWQEYWGQLSFPPQGIFLMKRSYPHLLQVGSLPLTPTTLCAIISW